MKYDRAAVAICLSRYSFSHWLVKPNYAPHPPSRYGQLMV